MEPKWVVDGESLSWRCLRAFVVAFQRPLGLAPGESQKPQGDVVRLR